MGIQTAACRKNDYHLGPFFSEADGIVRITRAMLERDVSDTLSTGLMDYGGIEECAPDVAIRAWTPAETARAGEGRREVWTDLLAGEALEYRSIEELIGRFARSVNHYLRVPEDGIRDRWDGSRRRVEYDYVVYPKAPA
jgi:hypothetical protein